MKLIEYLHNNQHNSYDVTIRSHVVIVVEMGF